MPLRPIPLELNSLDQFESYNSKSEDICFGEIWNWHVRVLIEQLISQVPAVSLRDVVIFSDRSEQTSHAEIAYLKDVLLAQENIFRLDVQVNDASSMQLIILLISRSFSS